MVGTKAGAVKAVKTTKERYGNEFYAGIGRIGGQNGHTGGFASMSPERRAECGKKGGSRSRRGPAKRPGGGVE